MNLNSVLELVFSICGAIGTIFFAIIAVLAAIIGKLLPTFAWWTIVFITWTWFLHPVFDLPFLSPAEFIGLLFLIGILRDTFRAQINVTAPGKVDKK